MASTYYRGGLIWIAYRDTEGKRRNKSTGLRKSNPGERRQAAKLREEYTRQERAEKPAMRADWRWVPSWVEMRWQGRTLLRVRGEWRRLSEWLADKQLPGPVNVRREDCMGYIEWRRATGAGRNTAANELQLFGMIMDEAIHRGHIDNKNPARNLRLKRAPSKPKEPFSDEQLAKLDAVFAGGRHNYPFDGKPVTAERYGWLHCSFLLGRYQAARLQQARVPLSAIDLAGGLIHWPASIMKHGRAFTQPIDKRLLPELREIVRLRREAGKTALCDIPELASIHWRRLLDALGMANVSHHSLRVYVVSQMALKGIPEAIACRFTGHSSVDVHRIYLKLTTADIASQLEKMG